MPRVVREVIELENYVKAVLYVYPRLKDMEEDYEEHIRNVAYMSYASKVGAERSAVYLAEEIIRKELLRELREISEQTIGNLSETEKCLLEVRYFRRKLKLKEYVKTVGDKGGFSPRSYFRRQKQLLKKVGEDFKRYGLTEERFFEDFAQFGYLKTAYRYITDGKEKTAAGRERALVGLLCNGR